MTGGKEGSDRSGLSESEHDEFNNGKKLMFTYKMGWDVRWLEAIAQHQLRQQRRGRSLTIRAWVSGVVGQDATGTARTPREYPLLDKLIDGI